MKTVEMTEWAFGGSLRGVDTTTAIALLAALFALSVLCAVFSYRLTLRPLPMARRAFLVGLRSLLFFLLFLCLANPTRVEQKMLEPSGIGSLAVVVDVSDSMTRPDNRRRSRLDHASSFWKEWGGQAEGFFNTIRYFQLAENTRAVASFEAALSPTVTTEQTRFYQSGAQVVSAGGDDLAGLVYITDALDTIGGPGGVDEFVAAARARQLPVYFIPGVNRLKGAGRALIEQVSVPTRVVQRSGFEYEAVYRLSSGRARTVPVRLFQDDTLVAEQTVEIRAGENIRRWGVPLQVEETGVTEIRLEVGEGDLYAEAIAEVQVRETLSKKVLFYVGALDWGYRFLSDALHEDPSFEMDTIFSRSTGLRRMAFSQNSRRLDDLPTAVSDLDDYDIVILLQPFVEDISEAQQEALSSYVRGGGAVLFAISNTEGSRAFADTAIERMLPVVLDASEESPKDRVARNFQAAMKRTRGGSSESAETEFAVTASANKVTTPLAALDAVEGSEFAAMFAQLPVELRTIAPEYYESARVEYSKAAAQVQSQVAKNEGSDILLATQTFGLGQSSILTTDLFWRWHLSRPSDDPASSIFWQQMITWLARSSDRDIHFVSAPLAAKVGEKVGLKFAGAQGAVRAMYWNLNDGQKIPLPVGIEDDEGLRMIETDFPEGGNWLFQVEEIETSAYARAYLTVDDGPAADEDVVQTVDFETMKEIARRTGGAVLQNSLPREWSDRTSAELLLDESVTLRWHKTWLLLAILVIYASELILRRRARLL
jgi:uncharacterized membrane protein